jgi:hypothetical protein
MRDWKEEFVIWYSLFAIRYLDLFARGIITDGSLRHSHTRTKLSQSTFEAEWDSIRFKGAELMRAPTGISHERNENREVVIR